MKTDEKFDTYILSTDETDEANDLEPYWLWLCSCPLLSRSSIMALVRYFGSPKEIYKAPSSAFAPWRRLNSDRGSKWLESLMKHKENTDPVKAASLIKQAGISFVSRDHADYPKKLLSLPDMPFGLFFRGRLPDPELPSVAVVGARMCSNYGCRMASAVSRALAASGCQIISGMAMGIDGTAQSACIDEGGSSFAILGSGPDVCYPREHEKLFNSLPQNGGIISEYAPGTPPLKQHFPDRNRLISAFSDALVIIEAREKSGSLITADFALDQGKDIYAVPGRVNDSLSYGCNRLIEQGASIVLSVDGLIESLKASINLRPYSDLTESGSQQSGRALQPDNLLGSADRPESGGKKRADDLSPEEFRIIELLSDESTGVDELAAASGLPLPKLMQILLLLQMKGRISEISKNRYVRLR